MSNYEISFKLIAAENEKSSDKILMISKMYVICIIAFFLSGCFPGSYISSKLNASLVAQPLSSSLTSLKILENKSLGVSGGSPPYTYEVLSGDLTVSPSGTVQSYSTKAAQVKITDSQGQSIVIDVAPTIYDSITSLNIETIRFSQDKTKAVISVKNGMMNYSIYAAEFDIATTAFSNLTLMSSSTFIPSVNHACSAAQITPNGSKIVLTAETSAGGSVNECELWSMDFSGQNALQLSEELSVPGQSVQDEVITSDGLRILYLDGLDAAFVDNELALKIVNLDGSNRMRLHPVIASDWGVTAFQEVPGANRVLFNHNNPANPNRYRTYTARMDGSDAGATVTLSATSGYVGIGSTGTLFANNTKVLTFDSKDGLDSRTVEIGNVDGTGKQIIETVGGATFNLIDIDASGEMIYLLQTFGPGNSTIRKYTPGAGLSTILNVAGTISILSFTGGYIYYLNQSGTELHRILEDGSGDTIINHPGTVGRVSAVKVLSNNDVYFISEKDVAFTADLYKYSFAGSTLTRLTNQSYVIGSAFSRWESSVALIGTSTILARVCTSTYSFGSGCNAPKINLYYDVTGANGLAVERPTAPNLVEGSGLSISTGIHSIIQVIWGSFGARTEWFGF